MAEEDTAPVQQPTAHGKRSGAARRKLRKERQAQLDTLFANLEINPEEPPRLPPKLVYYILKLYSDLRIDARWESRDWLDRRAFLRNASLVCSFWRTEAQRLLWEAPNLKSDDAMRNFLAGA
ncbi:hypothetical protein BCR35DRAFT_332971 [Leucosporidium creatinivorum]|uniref:F-box domain-containing protein n=1 Tax=Leucosporidium creatinivorum TaxID=106004 RepID=A0A1Y2EWV6_9BASI|nr:hypothetical protein BCR35DRAFT_332971 [Leucosporidium creatinivorum]